MGTKAWVEDQLSMPANGPEITAHLDAMRLWIEFEGGQTEEGEKWDVVAEYRPLQWMNTDPADMLHLVDYEQPLGFAERERPATEVIAASLMRAVNDPAQLREIMTQFWHEHFSVNATKSETTSIFFPQYDNHMRQHAFGNFRELLGAVAHSPSMLIYLNNDDSRASPANENYARELLELHTLGQDNYFNDLYDDWKAVPGATEGAAKGYIDQDVYEVARAFTGWTVGDGRWVTDDTYAPMSGKMHYVEAWHDPYQKRILGHEFPPNSAPMADAERVLDILAAHKGTARFITQKMLRRLGIEHPSEGYHADVAKTFHDQRDAPDQIAQTLRAIIYHSEFTATPPDKLQRPFEFLAAFYRASETNVSPRTDYIYELLTPSGWHQHRVNPPTGHSDSSEDWANTGVITGMISIAMDAHAEWREAEDGLLSRTPKGVTNFGALTAHWEVLFDAPKGTLDAALAAFDIPPNEPLWDDPGGMEWVNSAFLSVLVLRPEFMFR